MVIKEDNKGNRKCSFYHHQNGFGRVMYLALMDMVMTDYNKDNTFSDDYDFFKTMEFHTNPKLHDITDEVPEEVYEAVDLMDIKTIKDVFDYGDNNNGGMVIYVRQGEMNYSISKFKIGFMLGDEECSRWDETTNMFIELDKPFSRWVSPSEYGVRNMGSNYSDPTFVKMFNDFCNYFGVETFKNSEVAEPVGKKS